METIFIRNIMTDKLTVASIEHKFSQVMEFFNRYSIHHLPVTDGNKIIGIISVSDIMKAVHRKLATGDAVSMQQMDETIHVKDVMTHTLVTIGPDADIEEGMAILLSNGIHALPVVEGEVLQGIVTDYDIMKVYFKERRPPQHFSIGTPGFGV